MFSGISGAAMLIPVFLIAFPLLGVPQLTTVEAIGTSLLLETSVSAPGSTDISGSGWSTRQPRGG